MARNEKDEDVTNEKLLFKLPFPISGAGCQAVNPNVNRAIFDRRPQIARYER